MTEMTTCSRCVMNNRSDEFIEFDNIGHCNYCTKAIKEMDKSYFPGPSGGRKLALLLSRMREAAKKQKYDCIMGLSGGLDSSYLAYLGHKWGLRVLAVHIDDGFDSDVSKRNIESLVAATGFDYLTIEPDAEQFADLMRSYMLAGVPNIAVPQDNVLFAFLYHQAMKNGIKYFASGGNYALESILQKGNSYTALDTVNIKDIHRQHGAGSIKKLKFLSETRTVVQSSLLGMNTVRPLNLIDYDRDRAFSELAEFCGFEYYGGKHLENHLTKFIQLYWLNHKFGVDKRTSHLSSMIISGQMTRQEAILELKLPLYQDGEMASCVGLVSEKLNLSEAELLAIMESPNAQHESYRTQNETINYRMTRWGFRFLGKSGAIRRTGRWVNSMIRAAT